MTKTQPPTHVHHQPHTHRIGAHVSAAGGVHNAIARASQIGGNCVQVFSGSPRGWSRPALSDYALDKVFSEQEKYGVKPIITHALYLINLVSENKELREKSVAAIMHDLYFDSLVQGSGVVVHLGSHQGRGWEAVREGLIEELAAILTKTPEDSKLLIENSAGQNGKLCTNLEEITWIYEAISKIMDKKSVHQRLGWCFDTCHAHAAGYSLAAKPSSAQRATPGFRGSVITEITTLGLWDSLGVVHVNDSRDAFASGRDRHDNLGEGQINAADLAAFLNLPQLAKVPFIMEVPGFEGVGPDAENITRLKQIVKV